MNQGEDERSGLDDEERAQLYDFLCAIDGLVELDRLLPQLESRTRSLFGVESSVILLLDAATAELYRPLPERGARGERREAMRCPADRGIAGAVVRSGAAEHVPAVRRDPRWSAEVDGGAALATQALLCAPLPGGAGQHGVLSLRNKLQGRFTAADLRLVRAVAQHAGRAIDAARQLDAARADAARLREQVALLQQQGTRGAAGAPPVVGHSGAMRRVFQLIDSAAGLSVPVLITGDRGAGKAMIARAIHAGSARRVRPFVAVDCGALSGPLLEGELFGHRKGAIDGAAADQHGALEVADGGTVFLDDVAAMPLAIQEKLLRALDEGRIVPAGDTAPRAIDVRIIAATDRDLEAAMRTGSFRADLGARLGVFTIAVPPLRERREDIPVLAAQFLERTLRRFERPPIQFTPAALTRLCAYDWPGNVRELQNEVERAVVLSLPGRAIDSDNLSDSVRSGAGLSPSALDAGATPLRRARDLFERDFIARALAQNGGNASRAARALGISRVMLHKKLRAYGMRRMDLLRASA